MLNPLNWSEAVQKVKELEKENQRLREALEYIANNCLPGGGVQSAEKAVKTAREALKK